MRTNINLPVLSLAALSLGVHAQASAKAKKQQKSDKPNIVFILADDIGYGDLSCYGATKVSTPNLDKLAKSGRQFMDMHSASAVSTPSRYSLLTGEYSFRANIFSPATSKTPLLFNENKLTLADVLQKSGYKTAVIGKWHLGIGKGVGQGKKRSVDWNAELKPGPLELGFDYFFGVPVVNSIPPYVLVENHGVVGYDPKDPFVAGVRSATKAYDEKGGLSTLGGAKKAHELYIDEMLGTTFAEKSVKWIKDNKDNPFFLYLATTNIHHPFTPNPKFVGTSKAGIYGDFIHELDWIVGQVVGELEKQGLLENTIILFSSDNGGMLNHGGQGAMKLGHKINGELFGFKFDAWEGGHSVPLIASWKGVIKPAVSEQLISNVDMVHTFASLVGYELGAGDAPDSYNMLPVLLGETQDNLRESLLVTAHKKTHTTYREGDWVYITAQGGGGFVKPKPGEHMFGGPAAASYYKKPNSDIENGKFKEDAPKEQLYNLKDDPYQTTNLAAQNPEKLAQMKAACLKAKSAPTRK